MEEREEEPKAAATLKMSQPGAPERWFNGYEHLLLSEINKVANNYLQPRFQKTK